MFLFNFSNIGYQTYYVNQESIQLMDKMYFDIHLLGEFRNKIQESKVVELISGNENVLHHIYESLNYKISIF